MGNKNNTSVFKQLVELDFNITGLEKIEKQLPKFDQKSDAYHGLSRLIAMFSAYKKQMRELSDGGLVSDAKAMATELNNVVKLMNDVFSKLGHANTLIQGTSSGSGKSASRRVYSTKQSQQILNALDLSAGEFSFGGNYFSQANNIYRSGLRKTQIATGTLTQSAFRELDEDKFDVTYSQNELRAEVDRANKLLKIEEERLNKSKQQLLIESKMEVLDQHGIDLKAIENKQYDNAIDKLRDEYQINQRLIEYQKLKIQLAKQNVKEAKDKSDLPRLKQELKAEESQLAVLKQGNNERQKQIKLGERVERQQHKITNLSNNWLVNLVKSTTSFFSMEKIISRMSFVITAKLSYDLFNFLQRLPRQALTAFVELESEMSKTFALMAGVSEITKNSMTNNVVELSKKYGVAAKEISGALYEIVSAQVPLASVNRVLEQSLKLSIGGAGDLRDAAKSLVQIANAYGNGFKDIERISDVAFQSVKYGQLTMQQYTEQMQKVIATASIFKISQEEISAAISTMTINGIGAEQAFTALNQMLMQIANPTEKASKLMQQLGISLTVGDIQELGLGGALERLLPLMNATDQSGRELISILFKSRTGFKAVASLLQNLNEYGDNYINMLNSAGATNEALAQRSETVSIALNRVKESWNAMLMSIASQRTGKILTTIDKLSKLIEWLTNNSNLLWLAMKAVFSQLGTFGVIQIGKMIHGLAGIKSAFAVLRADAMLTAQTLSLAWTKITLGLSLLVQLLVQFVHWISVSAEKAREAKINKAFGLDKAANDAKKLNGELIKLDSTINKLNGIEKMINAYNQLALSQDKSSGAAQRSKKIYESISETLRSVNVDIVNTVNGTIDAAKTMEQVIRKISELNKKRAVFSSMSMITKSKLDSADSIRTLDKNNIGISALKYNDVFSKIFPLLQDYATNKKQSSLNKAISATSIAESQISKSINDVNAILEGKPVTNVLGENVTYERTKKLIESANEQRAILYSQLEAINAISLELMPTLIDDIDLPDKQVAGGGSGSESKRSFLAEFERIFNDTIGSGTFQNIAEVLASINKQVSDLETEMAKYDGKILDKEATRKQIAKIKSMTDSQVFVQLFGAMTESINKEIELAGLMSGSERQTQIGKLMKMYNELQANSSRMIENINNLGLSESEMKTLKDNLMLQSNSSIQSFWNKMKQDLPEEFIEQFMAINQVDDFYNQIKSEYEESLANNDGYSQLWKFILDSTIDNIINSIDNLLDPNKNPEWVGKIESLIKDAIEKGTLKTKQEIDDVLLMPENRGLPINESQRNQLYGLLPTAEAKQGFDWKKAAGIPNYKDQNEMDQAMAEKTVSSLQQIWSFYWNWEIEQLRTQQDKKLELMKTEKDKMLSNSNMSAEQEHAISEKYAEKERLLREKMDKQMSSMKRRQAIFEATIDYAKGIIGIWANQLAKGNPIGATIYTGLLSGIFTAQMAMIQKQKFASGGLTGSGYGSPDETGYKQAGIVHEGELVIDKKTLDNNYNQLVGLYSSLKSGSNFDGFIGKYLAGKISSGLKPSHSGNFAKGGLVGSFGSNQEINVSLDLKGIRVLDPIDIAKLNIQGSKRMRLING